MGFIALPGKYPFSGALTKFHMPPGPDDWQPKAWGVTATLVPFVDILVQIGADFITDGVAIDDILYITDSDPLVKIATTVKSIIDLERLELNEGIGEARTDVVFKVGMKAPHTLHTLATIISQRGIYPFGVHWSIVWTNAPTILFDHDENGDVYVCHNMDDALLLELQSKDWFDEDENPIPNPWLSITKEPKP